jgi:hypothetical protein
MLRSMQLEGLKHTVMAKPITIQLKESGSFQKTFKFLKTMKEKAFLRNLDAYGRKGVAALASATPVKTGLTANSWNYEIENDGENIIVRWYNTNVIKDYFNVAIMLQYGHGTGTGGWVQGRDYINPAIQPIFDKMAADMWYEVQNS